jgi:hypothetical protein
MEAKAVVHTAGGDAMTGDSLYCLVDRRGTVHVTFSAESFADVARQSGVSDSDCHLYSFDLTTRRLTAHRATPASAIAAQSYFNQHLGTPERLMAFAEQGHLPKRALANLLSAEYRLPYLEACARIERRYTEACTASHDPCLESGCSVEGEDETCLQPLLNAGVEYYRDCASEWIKAFRTPAHRVDAWKA